MDYRIDPSKMAIKEQTKSYKDIFFALYKSYCHNHIISHLSRLCNVKIWKKQPILLGCVRNIM